MPILRKFKRKEKGVEETVHLGALAQNITQDATHRFVTDVEKQAWNAKPGADTQNLKTYTALSQLGLSAPVTMEQIYSQMPSSSFFIMGVEGTGDISNLPENDTYGIIEIFKRDRNFARFTPSLSSAMAGSMFYGTFSWSGGVAFTGWKRIIDDKRLANNLTTTAEGYGLDARQGKVLMDKANQLSSELAAMNDNGLITGLEVREGDGVYITYQDGADTVSKKLGNPSKLSFDISGSGDNPNYLSSATFQFHRTSFDGFLNAGYTKCKITFISFSGAQSTGRLDIRKNGVVSTYYTNPGTVEFELEEGDYIAGYVSEQRTFRFSATVTMLC